MCLNVKNARPKCPPLPISNTQLVSPLPFNLYIHMPLWYAQKQKREIFLFSLQNLCSFFLAKFYAIGRVLCVALENR
jgi:hypothetical protein